MQEFFISLIWEKLSYFIANLSWIIAVWILLYGLSQKDDVKSIKIVTISIIFWTINYALLGLISALLATGIACVRMYCSLKFKWNMKVFSFLLVITFIAGYFSFDGSIISSLPIIASVAGIVWFQVYSWIKMRLILLCSSFLWLVYSIKVGNTTGIINEILVELVMISTILRMHFWEDDKITLRQKVRIFLSQKSGTMRPRIDFGRYLVFRDKKRYLNDDFTAVYEWDERQLKSTL